MFGNEEVVRLPQTKAEDRASAVCPQRYLILRADAWIVLIILSDVLFVCE